MGRSIMSGRGINSFLSRFGFKVLRIRDRYAQDGLFTLHSEHFRQDPAFRAAYDRALRAVGDVDPGIEWRVHVALWAARTALRVSGDFVECGVNAGFISSALMQGLQWNTRKRRYYLIDTYSGPVFAQYSEDEIRRGRLLIAKQAIEAGAYVTDMERIRTNFAEWPQAVIVRGTVPEVLPTVDSRAVAFLHLDMNCALPEVGALEFFWSRLSPGAIILLDDYGYFGHDAQREAMEASLRAKGADVLVLPTGQGLVRR